MEAPHGRHGQPAASCRKKPLMNRKATKPTASWPRKRPQSTPYLAVGRHPVSARRRNGWTHECTICPGRSLRSPARIRKKPRLGIGYLTIFDARPPPAWQGSTSRRQAHLRGARHMTATSRTRGTRAHQSARSRSRHGWALHSAACSTSGCWRRACSWSKGLLTRIRLNRRPIAELS